MRNVPILIAITLISMVACSSSEPKNYNDSFAAPEAQEGYQEWVQKQNSLYARGFDRLRDIRPWRDPWFDRGDVYNEYLERLDQDKERLQKEADKEIQIRVQRFDYKRSEYFKYMRSMQLRQQYKEAQFKDFENPHYLKKEYKKKRYEEFLNTQQDNFFRSTQGD